MKKNTRIGKIDILVSKNLKTIRTFRKVSLRKLGEVLDVSVQQIQKYEQSKNRISSGKLYVLAEYLQIPIKLFFDENLIMDGKNEQ